MPDKFTQVSRKSYGSKVKNAFGGVVLGLILFVAAFPLLYWNEGRADVSELAATATVISSESIDSSADGTLISTTGELTSEKKLDDDLFLQEGNYILLNRTVEMYSWVETVEEESDTELGGSETVTTTYEYDYDWVEEPASSSDFEYPENHFNPAKQYDSEKFSIAKSKVGAYTIDVPSATMPAASDLALTAKNTIANKGAILVDDQYLFMGNGSLDNPQVGDLRISYTALVPGATVTAFGKLNGSALETYTDEEGSSLYRVYKGTHDEAVSTMHTEHVTSTWILRAVGFIMMWVGLGMLLAPISTMLDILPFLGEASKALISIVTFVISLILAGATILVSMILHNLIALLVVLGVLVVGIIVVIVLLKKKKQPSKQTSE